MRRLLFLTLLVLAGCDRAELDDLEVGTLSASPDLDVVRLSPDLRLELRPSRQSGVAAVRIGQNEVPFDSVGGAFVFDTVLEDGLNTFILDITDDDGEMEIDTLYALYLDARQVPLGSTNALRVDAAISQDLDGRPLISGGSDGGGRALSTGTLLNTAGSGSQEIDLLLARTGHTASQIESGTLLLGGTTSATPSGPASFVNAAEFIDGGGRLQRVVVEGGFARTGHTVRVLQRQGQSYVYAYGGQVPTPSGVTVSGTVDVFRFDLEDDDLRLVRVSPPGGAGAFPPLVGHLDVPSGTLASVILGVGQDPSFAFQWVPSDPPQFPYSFTALPAVPLQTERSDAAAVRIGSGLTAILGGRTPDGEVLSSIEVYALGIDRSFVFPPSVQLLVPRADHTATILGANRIVISGGRTSDGTPLASIEALQL
ncbi:Kelch repeat-containing protein [Rubrivirga sp.]|uniref:Kelch repeat-containing protein n=1 Tax=Rubrivirga sp. TaxID=1885344 RepID=UPI003C73BA52